MLIGETELVGYVGKLSNVCIYTDLGDLNAIAVFKDLLVTLKYPGKVPSVPFILLVMLCLTILLHPKNPKQCMEI